MGFGKNNRRRGKRVVTRKQKSTFKFTTKYVGDKIVKKHWNHHATVQENYIKMGLQSDANDIGKEKNENNNPKIELFNVPDSDDLHPPTGHRPAHHMPITEQTYLRALIKVYGEDYERMSRDRKLNDLQWTVAKVTRRIARLQLLDAQLL